jgi:hypothetical protein
LSKQLFIGPVGYFYQQISADSGQAALTADRIFVLDRRQAGIPEFEGLL